MSTNIRKKLIVPSIIFFSIFSINHCYAVSVGDSYGGGTVFCVSQTADTSQCVTTGSGNYGLVMANEDQADYLNSPNGGITWSSINFNTNAVSSSNGAANTAAIIAARPNDTPSNNAAWLCHNYRDPGAHADWYLPSKNELDNMYVYARTNNLIGTGCTGSVSGGVQCLVGGHDSYSNKYWSSSESSVNNYCYAWPQSFNSGGQDMYGGKINGYYGVRAIRAFIDSTIQPFNKAGTKNRVLAFSAADFINNFGSANGSLTQVQIISLPSHGTLKLSGTAVTASQKIPVGNLGSLTYAPTTNWSGSDSFSWNGSNGTQYTVSTANVNIAIGGAVSVGDSYGGGTVFCVSQTADTSRCATTGSGNYGLVMANEDQANYNSNADHGITWASVNLVTNAVSSSNGAANTVAIVAARPNDTPSNNAAWLCHNYRDPGGHADWYLPSQNELNNMYVYANANNLIGEGCSGAKPSGFQCLVGGSSDRIYWSSSEYFILSYLTLVARLQSFSLGYQAYTTKNSHFFGVRAVRAFNNLTIQPFNKAGTENRVLAFSAADFINNFGSASGSLMQVQIISLPSHGILKLSGTAITASQEIPVGSLGNLTYTPTTNWSGSDSFSWNGSDGMLYTSAANVNIAIGTVVSVGESYGGGIVFCVSQTADTSQCVTTGSGNHGLIMANVDQANHNSNANHGITWSSVSSTTNAVSLSNGAANTATIVAVLPNDTPSNNAAWLCHNYRDSGGHADWYLPSQNELNQMYLYANANNLIGKGCSGAKPSGFQCLVGYGDGIYWSSSEVSDLRFLAWFQGFSGGYQLRTYKDSQFFGVRAVRAFSNSTIQPFNKAGVENAVLGFSAADFINNFSDANDSLTKIQITSLPSHGTLNLLGTIVTANQEILVESLGNLTYTPTTNWSGSDSFSWNGSNGTQYAVSVANVNIAIAAAPVVSAIPKSGIENALIAFSAADFISKFTDASGGSLTKIQITSLPSHGTINLLGAAVTANQEIPVGILGNLTYTPTTNWSGSDSFTWNGSDGTQYAVSAANVNIAIAAAPVVSVIPKSGIENALIGFSAADFTSKFADASGGSLTKIQITSLPIYGTLNLSGTAVTANQEIPVGSLGSLTYAPTTNWSGNDSFSWNGSDGTQYAVSAANINIEIAAAPVVRVISKSGIVNALIGFSAADFTSKFADASGGSLTKIQITSLPSHGTLKLSGSAVAANQEIPVGSLGNLTYTPTTNWSGSDSFSWNGSNGTQYAVSAANGNVAIAAAPPVVSVIPKSGIENSLIAFNAADFTSKFTDASGGSLTKIRIVSLPSHGTLKLLGAAVTANQEIPVGILGSLTYTPTTNWSGSDSFSWNGSDGTQYAVSSANVSVTVTVAVTPVVNAIPKSGVENTPIIFNATDFMSKFTNASGGSLTKIQITSLPIYGTLNLSGTAVSANQEIFVGSLGNLTYIPTTNWSGSDSFSWNGSDGTQYAVSAANVNITIAAAPVVSAIPKSGTENTLLAFSATDFTGSFTDASGGSLTKIQITSLPSHGTLKLSGTAITANQEIPVGSLGNLTYTPTTNWSGSDSFGWNGSDGTQYAVSSANVNVAIAAAPVVSVISKSGIENTPVAFSATDFAGSFTDASGGSLTKIQIGSLPSHGTLKLSGTAVTANQEIPVGSLGSLTYVPTTNWNGNDSFNWNGSNGTAYAANADNVNITITIVSGTPIVSAVTKSGSENALITFSATDFTSKFTNTSGGSLTKIRIASLPSHGTLNLSGTAITANQEIPVGSLGGLTYVPTASWSGSDGFSWNGSNGAQYAVSASNVIITIDKILAKDQTKYESYCENNPGVCYIMPSVISAAAVVVPVLIYLHKNKLCCFRSRLISYSDPV